VATAPTGTVSFLFTDVAGSTRLWDADREGMEASLAAHDRILTAAVEDHAGYVFSIAGDSYGAAFPTAAIAVDAALQAQVGLARESWTGPPIRVRMGIHTGTSQERAGNYFGPEVNRAARVMSAANGGQVLVSGATAQLLAGGLAPPATLVDRDIHDLKDLDRPEHLYELRHPELPEVHAPLHTVDKTRFHLPAQLTSFVGRDSEVAQITELLGSSRLVTLTGSGGTGKTRLAMEAARTVEGDHPDGAWMVELGPVADDDLVVNEVADLWELRPGDGVPLERVVTAYLSTRRLLLVVDNCEHVLETVSALIGSLLVACPHITVLATSRGSLGIAGETVYRVPPMGLPADDADPTESDSVRLFLDRARRVRPDLAAGIPDIDGIVRICRRLDGIPLGIELAVARLRTLSPSELADRLDHSFRILSGSKSSTSRQRTLETTIGWSHDLLDDDQRAMFRRLSVFAGGFDLAAAEVVGAEGTVEDWQVLDLLDQLVDKSLVVAEHGAGDTTRFRMQEPIRQYARERLDETSETEAARQRHARHYAARIAALAPRLRNGEQRRANDELLMELDNVRSTLTTFRVAGAADEFLETCFHLLWFWGQSSLLTEARDVLVSGLRELGPGASPSVATRAWWAATVIALFLTDPEGADFASEGMASARKSGDERLIGWMSIISGVFDANLGGSGEAGALVTEGDRLIRANPGAAMWDPDWEEAAISFFVAFGRAGDAEYLRARVDEATTWFRRIGDGYMAATAHLVASYLANGVNDEWVLSHLRASMTQLRALGFRHSLGHALFYYGVRAQDMGVADGIEELGEASTILAEVGDIACSTWSGMRQVGALLDEGAVDVAGRRLATIADRLDSYEGDVPTDLATQACRWATDRKELRAAARFLGHAEIHEADRSPECLASCRATIEDQLTTAQVEECTTEGAHADRTRILHWIADLATEPAVTIP